MVRTLIWSLAVAAGLSSAAPAGGDPVKGEAVFNRCGQCHNAVKSGIAARLIERMEEEQIISKPNHKGIRELLLPDHEER